MSMNVRIRKRSAYLNSKIDLISLGDSDGNKIGLLTGSVNRVPVAVHDGSDEVVFPSYDKPWYVISIPTEHDQIHEGRLFRAVHRHSLAQHGIYYYVINTPANISDKPAVHMTLEASSTKLTYVDLYEDTTKGDGSGTAVVSRNARRKPGPPEGNYTYIETYDTISDEGTLIDAFNVNGSLDNRNKETRYEWILKNGLNYLVKITTVEDDTEWLVKFIYYETMKWRYV